MLTSVHDKLFREKRSGVSFPDLTGGEDDDHPTGEYDATYEYDNNGNMTCRIEENITWVQEYNEENRIEKVRHVNAGCSDTDEAGDTQIWRFTYDGDGVRVYQEYVDASGTVKTYYFAGGMYEVEDDGSTTTKVYYSIGGISVAMDDGTDLVYFASDHLTSASIVMNDSGGLLSEQRYMPFGEVRTDVGTAITQTDFGYTGQRDNSYIKLLDYKARSYSPGLKRFISPDTIVPDLYNPQSLNRYSYAYNSPVVYIDPTGHLPEQGNTGEDCLDGWMCFDNPVKDYSADPDTYLMIYSGKKLVELGGKDDLEAMAQIIDKASEIYGNDDLESFLNGLTKVFNGVNYSGENTLYDAAQYSNCKEIGADMEVCGTELGFSDTGFHDIFKDGHNQLYHLWAYIATSASGELGMVISALGNHYHERVQDDPGASWQDWYLAVAGMAIGHDLYYGEIKASQLGGVVNDLIRNNPWDWELPNEPIKCGWTCD